MRGTVETEVEIYYEQCN